MPSAIPPGPLYRVADRKPGHPKPPGAVIVRMPVTEPMSDTAVQSLAFNPFTVGPGRSSPAVIR
jgi:hypothetical protein